jgi:hypothetical protein
LTKTEQKRTGLGLLGVDGFMRQSKGQAEIESRSGNGATNSLVFPADGPAFAAEIGQDDAAVSGAEHLGYAALWIDQSVARNKQLQLRKPFAKSDPANMLLRGINAV